MNPSSAARNDNLSESAQSLQASIFFPCVKLKKQPLPPLNTLRCVSFLLSFVVLVWELGGPEHARKELYH